MRYFRLIVPVVLLISCLSCYAQKAVPPKGTSKSEVFSQSPGQVYEAALTLIESSPNYKLIEKEDTTRTIRFRLAGRSPRGVGRYLSSGLFTVLDQPVGGKTQARLTMSIMSEPGTVPGLQRLSTLEQVETKVFYRTLKKQMAP